MPGVDDDGAEHGWAPCEIGVEGADLSVPGGATRTLERHRPVLVLPTPGPGSHRASRDLLRALGYGIRRIPGDGVKSAAEVLATPTEP